MDIKSYIVTGVIGGHIYYTTTVKSVLSIQIIYLLPYK
jgi:hypothetical protein